MSFSLNDFDNLPYNIIMTNNKNASLEIFDNIENLFKYLKVTVQANPVASPGVIFTGITDLIPNKQYTITITGWNNSLTSTPFIYVSNLDNTSNLILKRMYLNNTLDRISHYWQTISANFIAPLSGAVNAGVLIEHAISGSNFELHSIQISEKIPNKVFYINPEYDPLLLTTNDTSSYITSYFTTSDTSDTSDTPARVNLPENAPDGTNYTFTFAEGGLLTTKLSSIAINSTTSNISGAIVTANYINSFDTVDNKIVKDSMIINFKDVTYIKFTGTQGDSIIFNNLNNKWIVNGTVFLIDHSSIIETTP